MPKIVLDLNDRRPAWAPPDWVSSEIRQVLPDHWDLQVMATEADGSGDGAPSLSPDLLEAVRSAEVYLGYGVPAALLRAAPELRWVHSGAAGVGSSLSEEMKSSPVLFTNSKGIHGPPMGDTALAMILHFSRGLDFGIANKTRRVWNTDPYYAGDHPLTELAQITVGVFGFGGIGREVAKRARALGSEVMAYDRDPSAFGEKGRVTLGPDLDLEDPGLRLLHGEPGFRRLLSQADFLVLTAPETPETKGIINAEAMALMKPSAVLINISRGSLVVEPDLVEALKNGRLRGAGLDVFQKEPLPQEHPFWDLPNVLMTPHVSAVTRGFWRRQTDLIVENLRRYLAGDTLLNLVDREAGF
ncbi:MAG: D-2-hydroxyacid dehydrogenase [Gemmatimonadetes bacterium]|nr:D-2-hydroxyacid dehydrogenase [Gemmatimonadota bacterium]